MCSVPSHGVPCQPPLTGPHAWRPWPHFPPFVGAPAGHGARGLSELPVRAGGRIRPVNPRVCGVPGVTSVETRVPRREAGNGRGGRLVCPRVFSARRQLVVGREAGCGGDDGPPGGACPDPRGGGDGTARRVCPKPPGCPPYVVHRAACEQCEPLRRASEVQTLDGTCHCFTEGGESVQTYFPDDRASLGESCGGQAPWDPLDREPRYLGMWQQKGFLPCALFSFCVLNRKDDSLTHKNGTLKFF